MYDLIWFDYYISSMNTLTYSTAKMSQVLHALYRFFVKPFSVKFFALTPNSGAAEGTKHLPYGKSSDLQSPSHINCYTQ
jgi:hypothetical protein